MNSQWRNALPNDWSVASALDAIEDFGSQIKRNVDMRMRRGDVRSAILRLLLESPMHGYQMIHEIQERSGGAWKPSPGSVYPTLQLLTDEGLVQVHERDGRRTFELTASGREVAEADSQSDAPWQTGIGRDAGPRRMLAESGMKLAKSAAELAKRGNAEHMAQATQVLNDAAAALHRIVSQD